MLVGYSSSSSEEEGDSEAGSEAPGATNQSETTCRKYQEEHDGFPVRKKPKTEEEAPKLRLPLPGCLSAMFTDEMEPQTEDSSLHGGRIRSFKHERGNWATYVYFPYPPEDEFGELLDGLLVAAGARGVALTLQEEFHLSLSQTVVLRHHWIQPFTQSLKTSLARCKSGLEWPFAELQLSAPLRWLHLSPPRSCCAELEINDEANVEI